MTETNITVNTVSGNEGMTRIRIVENAISEAALTKKHIIYLVTEDRDILEELFDKAPATIASLGGGDIEIEGYSQARKSNQLEDGFERFNSKPYKGTTSRYIFIEDFHLLCAEPKTSTTSIRIKELLIEAKNKYETSNNRLVLFLISPKVISLVGFEQDVAIIYVPSLSKKEIAGIIIESAINHGLDKKEYEEEVITNANNIAGMFRGLSKSQLMDTLAILSAEFGKGFYHTSVLSESDVEEMDKSISRCIKRKRRESVETDSTITFKDVKNVIKGMETYVAWLKQEENDLLSPVEAFKWGRIPPKGVLFCGLPGTGKTEAAKYTADRLGIPLIELRMDNILDKHQGESESAFKQYRNKVNSLAPCIVLIDEIEKTIGDNNEGGSSNTKKHLLQALLDWMQEGSEGLFFFATCNSLRGLENKPELTREGRFSQKFSVFMPSYDSLVGMFDIHIKNVEKIIKENGGEMEFGDENFGRKAAEAFLGKIANEIEDTEGGKKGRNYFYTGSNAQHLINLTQQICHNNSGKKRYTVDEYAEKLFEAATSDFSLPYGRTNFPDIAEFWILARKNNYPDATGDTLFPFHAFIPSDGEKADDGKLKTASRFDPDEKLKEIINKHNYNKLMFEKITKEIIRLHDENISDKQNYRKILLD